MRKGFIIPSFRVVEFAEGHLGPWASLLLADLGAEVIKVESMIKPDMTRGTARKPVGAGHPLLYFEYPDGILGEKTWNRHALFNNVNQSKYGITLDLTKPGGLKTFMRLIKLSDVFLANVSAGATEKLGITYEALAKVNPQIIYLAASGFGRTGPYANRIAMGNTIDAASGFWCLRDYGDGDSTHVTQDTHCDSVGAVTSAFAILAALRYKKMTGKGVFIDVSMAEACMSHIGEAIMDYTMNQKVWHSYGNRDSMSFQGCYRCKGDDEWVTLSICSDEEWRRLIEVMDNPQWAKDNRFADMPGKLRNQEELNKLIEAWTICRTKFEVTYLLQGKGIAAGAVLNRAEVYSDPCVKERGFLEEVAMGDCGVRSYPGRLWILEETETPKRTHAPALGEHNDYVLREIVGLTADEILVLEQEGVIGTAPIKRW